MASRHGSDRLTEGSASRNKKLTVSVFGGHYFGFGRHFWMEDSVYQTFGGAGPRRVPNPDDSQILAPRKLRRAMEFENNTFYRRLMVFWTLGPVTRWGGRITKWSLDRGTLIKCDRTTQLRRNLWISRMIWNVSTVLERDRHDVWISLGRMLYIMECEGWTCFNTGSSCVTWSDRCNLMVR
jgi:hypothetical protein